MASKIIITAVALSATIIGGAFSYRFLHSSENSASATAPSPNPVQTTHAYIVDATGISCYYGSENWAGQITVDGHVFNEKGCGHQSWQFSGQTFYLIFNNFGCETVCIGANLDLSLRVSVMKDGQTCLSQSAQPLGEQIYGSC